MSASRRAAPRRDKQVRNRRLAYLWLAGLCLVGATSLCLGATCAMLAQKL